jgi:hypothetical protein
MLAVPTYDVGVRFMPSLWREPAFAVEILLVIAFL